MLKHFKNLELTRHQALKRTRRMIEDNNTKRNGNFDQLSETVFSSALSLFISYLAETYFVKDSDISRNPLCALAIFAIGIAVYLILFVLIKILYGKARKIISKISYERKINRLDISINKIKELVDDFDNITFDHLLLTYDLIANILSSNNKKISTFYFHEALYYLKTSVDKTKEIIVSDRIKQCLNIFGNTRGIDVFRLCNANEMMIEILNQLKQFYENSNNANGIIHTYDSQLNMVIEHQIKTLDDDIQEITKTCEQAKKNLK